MTDLGPLMMVGIKGPALLPEEQKFLQDEKIGGVILFSHNYESPEQLCELVNKIQACRDEHPMLISVDQEGGRVFRFKKTFTHFPSMLSVASLNSPKLCYEIYGHMARELSACGVNVDFAPVCDVLRDTSTPAIGDRSFGKDPEMVAKFVSAAIRGLQTNKVMAVAKHFPGHGNTTKDSHYELPKIDSSMDELQNIDLIPFQQASKSRVSGMMMGHLVFDSLDPKLPTSLSPKAYEFLREQMKFKKIIYSDDMEMHAITSHFPGGEAALMALNAGCDILVYRTLENAVPAFDFLKAQYKHKKLKAENVQEKLKRVEHLKKEWLPSYQTINIREALKVFQNPEARNLKEELEKKINHL